MQSGKLSSIASVGVVRSKEDGDALLASNENPLKGVDQKLVAGFTNGLSFKNGGLAHADYNMLEDAITLKQFRRLFEPLRILADDVTRHPG
jgi:hypothetical protein